MRAVRQATPRSIGELREECQGWPFASVETVVLDVITGGATAPMSMRALAMLVTAWLVGDDESDAPPLTARAVAAIWEGLQQQRH